MFSGNAILALAISYALGCVATGYYFTRALTGKDIRDTGSASSGARNVGRLLGRKGFVVTFAGDLLKGWLALWCAARLDVSPWVAAGCLLAVVAGHVWPAQLGFRGGRGVAVTLGALLYLDWRVAAGCAAVFALTYAMTRKYMASGLAAVIAMPALAYILTRNAAETRPPRLAGTAALSVLVLFTHRRHAVDFRQSA